MSDTAANTPPQSPATETSPPDAPRKVPRVKKPLVVPTKVQKKIDTLNTKIEKLLDVNKALKAQLTQVKTSHTRIRRIPKVATPTLDA